MNWILTDEIIKNALKEDMPFGDVTSEALIDKENCKVDLICKENGIICGLQVFERVFNILGKTEIDFGFKDGDAVRKGDLLGIVKGNPKVILSAERTALNFLQRMSGIASVTSEFVHKLEGTDVKLLDTRKTTPGLRILEKYAARTGGAVNHRMSLSDSVLIKDNHIDAAGGIAKAVEAVRQYMPYVRKIEVETETIQQVKECLEVKVDIIMLDNMGIEYLMEAVKLIDRKAVVEVSGNITLENIEKVAQVNPDYISTGFITNSAKALDISMKNLQYI